MEISDKKTKGGKRKMKAVNDEFQISVKKLKTEFKPCSSNTMDVENKSEKEYKRILKRELKIKPESCLLNGKVDEIEYIEDPKKLKTEVKKKYEHLWNDYELLAENQNLDHNVAKTIIRLFEDGNTIPFIARYRKEGTNNLSAEQLRHLKEEYDKICYLKTKTQTVLKMVEKSGKLDSYLEKTILSACTLEELEHIYAPYKPGTKRTLVERAKALGLEKPALDLLNGTVCVNLEDYVDTSQNDLSTIQDIEKGFMHIIASVLATNTEVLSLIRKLRSEITFPIECKKSNTSKKSTIKSDAKKSACKSESSKSFSADEASKFQTYFDFKISNKHIKPHQVLAINRGEALKILSVKVVVPDFVFNKFKNFCYTNWIKKTTFNSLRQKILDLSISDSYSRLVQPLIIRSIRNELKTNAERASCEVFSTNLKQLLLISPLRGRPILGIDPGFSNGCKLAVIDETGSVLDTAIVYPHTQKQNTATIQLKNLIKSFNCHLVALGNGTACRETETWLSTLIQNNEFSPLQVTYTIINESGASIYSCSVEASKEFPSVNPNIISAISLARRVQDPLAELVKVEPKHLGVGMYQHDLPKKQLEEALAEVVMECVSFVGVDLNTASQCLLRRISGLTDKRASEIILYREKNGLFLNRKDLLNVSGIGRRVFEQCAGFLRIGPATANQAADFYKNAQTNRLDCTYIHPESYHIAEMVIKKLNLNIETIGQVDFINTMERKLPLINIMELATFTKSNKETINLILEAFSKPLNFDMRTECSPAPLFKKGLTNIHDLIVGEKVTGSVTNITHFGCFVDIGVGLNGLIHQSKMKGFTLQIGDRVEVTVTSIEIDRKRIGLQMVTKAT